MIDEKNLKMIEEYAQNYAKSLILYGVDVSEKYETATAMSLALNNAYLRGRADGLKFCYEKIRKWIPCSERLPNDTAIHEVTAQFRNGTIYTEFAYYDESREEWWKFDDDGTVNVIAWKEHSKPYKGE